MLFTAFCIVAAGVATGQTTDRVLSPVRAAQPPDNLRLLEPVSYENLLVFPVVTSGGADTSGYMTLEEALASGDVVVTESGGDIIRRTRDGRTIPVPLPVPLQGGAQVNRLVLVYRGSKPLLLLAGEVVTGGKQDRVIAKDRIVAPGADPLPLDVFCVERGRWTGGSAQFSAAGLMAHPSVREKVAVDKKQDEVWAAVRSGTTSNSAGGAAGTAAPAARISTRTLDAVVADEARSESYGKIYASQRIGASVETFAEELQKRFARIERELKGERVVGVVVAYGGEVAWSDIFASAALFDRYWPKLLRSYVVEALARPQTQERAKLDDAREFLEPLSGRETVESEPGVYRWREITRGRYAEIELDTLLGKPFTIHRVKVHRTS